ncbi:RNA-directed DNA polymerase from mobile element jockey [Habropoda laboriosa]|uniref:RNA-directed DNA polymerase from mobile element jockey n=1 Tax=Habropoda laboriosa TaxID=597456 RepID=A0A0L7QQ20_9HYME|nr:RNA-directed DNA polymerase from mobile element jockey [Habropoda laboriosa]
MDPNAPRTVNLMVYNIQGIRNHTLELQHILRTHNIHIAIITETQLSQKTKISIPGYTIHRHDRHTHDGGVLILIQHDPITLPTINNTGTLETIAIKTRLHNHPLTIVGIYNPPRNNLNAHTLKALMKNGPTMLAGDFNARHQLWHCQARNANGRVINDLITHHPITICALYPHHSKPFTEHHRLYPIKQSHSKQHAHNRSRFIRPRAGPLQPPGHSPLPKRNHHQT